FCPRVLNATSPAELYPLSLHDALPIYVQVPGRWGHPLAAFLAGLLTVAELLQIYITHDPLLTSHLVLLILAVGSLFLAVDWFLIDRKSTRLNSSHQIISYASFYLKK